MIVFPNAKINLGLHVVSKRADGYHNLETIFYPVKLADALEMIESDKTGLSFSGMKIGGPASENLVLKAYHFLKEDFDLPPVQFHLHKVIPFGAGLGGGSSDAAFALKMLNDYFDLGLNSAGLKKYAARIGADCSFFIDNQPAFAEGIGDKLVAYQIDLSEFHIVILKPDVSVGTPEAYRNIIPGAPKFNLHELADLSPDKWKDHVVNDFEKSIFPQYPEIKELKETLYRTGAVYASMSGSGSAVYGIFRHLPTDFNLSIPKSIFIYR